MPNEELKRQNIDRALETACTCFQKYGVEFVTREMISRQSGISRASLGRYWVNKTDCVLKTAEWFRQHMHELFSSQFPVGSWENKNGIERLRSLMEWCRDLYREDPRLFSLCTEFKVYLYRSAPEMGESKKLLACALGFRSLVRKIYDQGIQDGSIAIRFDINDEVEFFGNAFGGYLSNLTLRPEISTEDAIKDIDRYIERMISLYDNLK